MAIASGVRSTWTSKSSCTLNATPVAAAFGGIEGGAGGDRFNPDGPPAKGPQTAQHLFFLDAGKIPDVTPGVNETARSSSGAGRGVQQGLDVLARVVEVRRDADEVVPQTHDDTALPQVAIEDARLLARRSLQRQDPRASLRVQVRGDPQPRPLETA